MRATSFGARQVGIVGLGLMGGSLGLALRRRSVDVIGYDPNPQACVQAVDMGAVRVAGQSPDALAEAQVLILAAPVLAIIEWLHTLGDQPALHPGPAIVFDLGSTKAHVLRAMEALPERFDPIGGHPMCGKESNSIRYAEAGLFENAAFVLSALERTTPAAREWAAELVQAVGARPLWLDGETHDRWAAAVSHAPYCLANSLAAAVRPEALPLAGPGLRSTTRLAGSSIEMMENILRTNRANVLTSLSAARAQLAHLEQALQAEDWSAVRQCLAAGQENYAKIRL